MSSIIIKNQVVRALPIFYQELYMEKDFSLIILLIYWLDLMLKETGLFMVMTQSEVLTAQTI